MSIAGDALPLRPLSIGEIFDRTVTLYVRFFGLFTLIMLVVILPLTVASYFGTYGNGTYQQVMQQASHPASVPSPLLFSRLIEFEGILMLVLLLQLLLLPFANTATASGVAGLYGAERPSWRRCYTAALRRWAPILGAELMTIVIVGAAVVAGAFAFGAIFAAGIFLVRGSTAAIVAFGFLIAIFMIAWILSLALCIFAMGFAFISIVVEKAGVFQAIGSGFARIFNRRELGRAVLVFLALIAVSIGLYIVLGIVALVAQGMTHNVILYGIVTAPISLVSSTFTALLFAVYYFDVRVRREGLDIQTQLDRLE
ncbi:MAG TPA: hypothetical protein VFW34_07145 [Candidatus Rubrimentiphilum sp.]|nr:hypothetical protein [Candidatus Rubrimentiphilum sp.]